MSATVLFIGESALPLLSSWAAANGCTVVHTHHTGEAVDRLLAAPAMGVVAEIQLGRLAELAGLARLRELPEGRDLPLLILALPSELDRLRAFVGPLRPQSITADLEPEQLKLLGWNIVPAQPPRAQQPDLSGRSSRAQRPGVADEVIVPVARRQSGAGRAPESIRGPVAAPPSARSAPERPPVAASPPRSVRDAGHRPLPTAERVGSERGPERSPRHTPPMVQAAPPPRRPAVDPRLPTQRPPPPPAPEPTPRAPAGFALEMPDLDRLFAEAEHASEAVHEALVEGAHRPRASDPTPPAAPGAKPSPPPPRPEPVPPHPAAAAPVAPIRPHREIPGPAELPARSPVESPRPSRFLAANHEVETALLTPPAAPALSDPPVLTARVFADPPSDEFVIPSFDEVDAIFADTKPPVSGGKKAQAAPASGSPPVPAEPAHPTVSGRGRSMSEADPGFNFAQMAAAAAQEHHDAFTDASSVSIVPGDGPAEHERVRRSPEQALASVPEDWFLEARFHALTGHPDRAAAMLDRCIHAEPHQRRYQYFRELVRGQTAVKESRPTDARAAFENALRLAGPGQTEAEEALAALRQ